MEVPLWQQASTYGCKITVTHVNIIIITIFYKYYQHSYFKLVINITLLYIRVPISCRRLRNVFTLNLHKHMRFRWLTSCSTSVFYAIICPYLQLVISIFLLVKCISIVFWETINKQIRVYTPKCSALHANLPTCLVSQAYAWNIIRMSIAFCVQSWNVINSWYMNVSKRGRAWKYM